MCWFFLVSITRWLVRRPGQAPLEDFQRSGSERLVGLRGDHSPLEVSRVSDPPAFDAKRLGNRGVVSTVKIDGIVALVESCFLTSLDPTKGTIREYKKRNRKTKTGNRLQFAYGEAETSVTHSGDDLRIGPPDLSPNCRRQRIAQRAVCPVRDEMPPRTRDPIKGRKIRARGTRICNDYCR